MTQPAVLWDAVCTARENKFLQQVYLPGEEVESEACSGREGGPSPAKGPVPGSAGSARLSRMKDELEWVPPMPEKPDQAHLAIPPLGATRKRQLPQKHKVAPITA